MSSYIDLDYITKIQDYDYRNLKEKKIIFLIFVVRYVVILKSQKQRQGHIFIE